MLINNRKIFGIAIAWLLLNAFFILQLHNASQQSKQEQIFRTMGALIKEDVRMQDFVKLKVFLSEAKEINDDLDYVCLLLPGSKLLYSGSFEVEQREKNETNCKNPSPFNGVKTFNFKLGDFGEYRITAKFRGTLAQGLKLSYNPFFVISNLFFIVLIAVGTRYLKVVEREAFSKTLIEISRQVAHDIRSPLTALNMVLTSAQDLPEEKRILVRNAVQRINDIANNLLERSKAQANLNANSHNHNSNTANSKAKSATSSNSPARQINTEVHLLSSLIDTIVSEKRIQFRDKINLQIEADLLQAYGLFAQVNAPELQRVLSNLINNSVEANSTLTKVAVRGYPSVIQVIVIDNGKGIPEEILNKLGEQGVTLGKEGTQSGSGLGVYHAKKAIESFGGKFDIQSQLNQGTIVTISLPRHDTPNWFVERLSLNPQQLVVSVDDDVSIHQIWAGRFSSLGIKEQLNHLSFTSTKNFTEWFMQQTSASQSAHQQTRPPNSSQTTSENFLNNVLFLVDYEFLGDSATGLDLIERLKIAEHSVLVTSRFEEPPVRERCERLKVKLIPKSMAGLVPIIMQPPKQKPHAILIDDDLLVHMTWKTHANEKQKNYAMFFSVDEFLKQKDLFDLQTTIYVDSNLGAGIKGEVASEEIYKAGFKNIFIATGHSPEEITHRPHIKGVVGKNPA